MRGSLCQAIRTRTVWIKEYKLHAKLILKTVTVLLSLWQLVKRKFFINRFRGWNAGMERRQPRIPASKGLLTFGSDKAHRKLALIYSCDKGMDFWSECALLVSHFIFYSVKTQFSEDCCSKIYCRRFQRLWKIKYFPVSKFRAELACLGRTCFGTVSEVSLGLESFVATYALKNQVSALSIRTCSMLT